MNHTVQADPGMTPMNIGFIGLGVMGAPMATHLARAGHALALLDADAQRACDLADALAGLPGARCEVLDTPAQVGERSDVVITMLPDGTVVRDVALGDQGLAGGMRPGTLLLDTSSSEPWLTQQTAQALAARGIAMVDAPVSGAQWGAQQAQLVFMAGGDAAQVQRVRPLLDRMGRAVFHLGGIGAGHAMKCINNLVTALTFTATAEGLVIGKRYGLDPAVMTDVLNQSTGMSWITQTHIRQRILSRSFDDPFKLDLMLKDIGIALELGREQQQPLPLSALGQQLWRAATLDAKPGASVSELARWVERQAATELTPGAAAS
jgi:3-hydroxyisobutyrate dehydrogenase